jgi:hypothetical protein
MTPTNETPLNQLTLSQLAIRIKKDWKEVHFAAKPYLSAMLTMDSIVPTNYGYDSGKSMVLYFLSNSQTWKGETAREIKKELKRRAK